MPPGREAWIDEPTADYGHRDRISFAILFTPAHPRAVRMIETCTYVAGDLPAETDGCVWIDKNSKPKNGLPYCW